ncbi:hypothetical protein SAMN04515674_101465 [Pseudarcicella hirudinis]|uniref:Uncharacterized protein n=1 Tax=Pseudarcicella hirudinis TaxID=1079859 RepID=A0A1I5MW09_9BACT|nr:hypothetical protein [Pseudarcicella hirudinis]SFP13517.1 hypothetical protein SAMN04515674_101465 [Pseudarcicella hirudinis]
MDIFIKAQNRQELDDCLLENGMIGDEGYICYTLDYCLNIVGEIGQTEGWHANIRLLNEDIYLSDSLIALSIAPDPETPENIWF